MSAYLKAQKATLTTPRFTRLDGAVADAKTGLIWSLEETNRVNHKAASDYCASLTLLGYSDWRLPSRLELETLRDLTRCDPAIDIEFFPGSRSRYYWASTPLASSPGECGWIVDLTNGDAYWGGAYYGYDAQVRAVRASQS